MSFDLQAGLIVQIVRDVLQREHSLKLPNWLNLTQPIQICREGECASKNETLMPLENPRAQIEIQISKKLPKSGFEENGLQLLDMICVRNPFTRAYGGNVASVRWQVKLCDPICHNRAPVVLR